jgi:hypothetical protein
MNILEIEDMIKGLPDQALQEEAQAPSGQVPQFLVVSEIQRRTDMRKRFQSQQQQPQNTVSDQIVQEGIAAIAPQQMPQQMPSQQMMPQQMYSGGIVEMRDMGSVPYSVDMGRFYDMYSNPNYREDREDLFSNNQSELEKNIRQSVGPTEFQGRIGEIIELNRPEALLRTLEEQESGYGSEGFIEDVDEVTEFKKPRSRRNIKEDPKRGVGAVLDDVYDYFSTTRGPSARGRNAPKRFSRLIDETVIDEDKSSTDKVIKGIEEGGTIVDPKSIANNAVIEDSINKQGTKLGGGAASSANPSGKADEDELQDITDTESLLAQINALRSTGREVKQPNYESFKDAAELRADKIREESRRDAYSQALIQFGAGVAEGDMAKGLRDAGLAVSKERSEGRKLATEEQRIQEAYALKIEEAESEAEKVRLERESDALTLASTVLGEMGKGERSLRGVITAILRDPNSAMLIYQQAQEEAARLAKSQGREPTQTDILKAYKDALRGFSQTFVDPQVSGGQIADRVIDFDAQGLQIQQ